MKQKTDKSFKDIKALSSSYSRTYKILENFYEKSSILFCTIDLKGNILDCNDQFVRWLGYSRDEIIGMPLFNHISPSNLVVMQEILDKWQEKGTIGTCIIWLNKKGNIVFPALMSGASIQDEYENTIGCNLAFIDQTDIYKTKLEIEKANEELKLKEQLKNEFIAIASHELRTPIQPILGYALLAKRGKISQDVAWDGVLKEARRLQQLANDILDVSRIESGSLLYHMEKIAIGHLLESVVNSATSNVGADVTLGLTMDDASRLVEAELDKSRMTQLLSNILGNAVKFTKIGTIKVECRMFQDKNKIEIKMSDTGGGIPQEVLPKLFGKFVTRDVGTSDHSGTGLGLFISKAIVTAHKGEIHAANNNHGGATFTVVLPIDQSKPIYD
ncbi:MAG TPA: PAS domain-containing sensor histidine kinase [Nitrososphaera sp.]|nr:PAS domain-containing sensor histidine kinase [Nitrososphaera sp.]